MWLTILSRVNAILMGVSLALTLSYLCVMMLIERQMLVADEQGAIQWWLLAMVVILSALLSWRLSLRYYRVIKRQSIVLQMLVLAGLLGIIGIIVNTVLSLLIN